MAKDTHTKEKKKKGGRGFHIMPETISVTFVWMIIFCSAVLLMLMGIVWSFLYHLQVTSNEFVDTGEVGTGRMQSINRDELAATIEAINERDTRYQLLTVSGPSVPEPSAVDTTPQEEVVLEGPVTSQ